MFSFFYDCILALLSLLALPWILWQRFFSNRYQRSLLQRLGLKKVAFSKAEADRVVWIHAVSMGEVRASIPLYQKIRATYPDARIVISTITETGQDEAKKSMPDADLHFYMPIDFSWVMKKLIRQIQPNLVILIESDFWYQFLSQAKKSGATTILVNGKISERSFIRFSKIPGFFRKILGFLDLLCVQNQEYRSRFVSLGAGPASVAVTCNIKLDTHIRALNSLEKQLWRKRLGLQEGDFVVTVASTHEGEEELILSQIYPLCLARPNVKILLVPRHPHRFGEVKALLQTKKIPYLPYSASESLKGAAPQVVLIDQMGILIDCYQMSQLSIVAGSFIDKVGGHNICEPIVLGVPVFFGPFMFSQKDLRDLSLSFQAGKQIQIQDLGLAVTAFMDDLESRSRYLRQCDLMRDNIKGALAKTWQACNPLIKNAFSKK